jgi:hypothetical protein
MVSVHRPWALAVNSKRMKEENPPLLLSFFVIYIFSLSLYFFQPSLFFSQFFLSKEELTSFFKDLRFVWNLVNETLSLTLGLLCKSQVCSVKVSS